MAHYFCCITHLFLLVVLLDASVSANHWSAWSSWSACSVSCGRGTRTRLRNCIQDISVSRNKTTRCSGKQYENGRCYDLLCPSYLDWPRIHFSGEYASEGNTVNNYRCALLTDHFCAHCDTARTPTGLVAMPTKGPTLPKFLPTLTSFNANGNDHFYFYKTLVTSACWNGSKSCVIKDPIVGRKVENPNPGKIIDLDNDWRRATEIFALKIHIPGVFTASLINTVIVNYSFRDYVTGEGSGAGYFKGKLVDVKWIDPYYREKFMNSSMLSTRFILDVYTKEKRGGRLAGTIGMSSDDDCYSNFCGRSMKSHNFTNAHNVEAPFFVSRKHKKLVLDLSIAMPASQKGIFARALTHLKFLDVVAIPESWRFCDSNNCEYRTIRCKDTQLFLLTQDGGLDFVISSQNWYIKRGGIVEISLSWANDELFEMISTSRLALISRKHIFDFQNINHMLCYLYPNWCKTASFFEKSCKFFVSEDPYGLNTKPMRQMSGRLNHGERLVFKTKTSSFGRPLKGALNEVRIAKKMAYFDRCLQSPKPCDPAIAWPKNALDIGKPVYSDEDGLSVINITVVKNPGFPRKCDLDGQVYPLGIIVTYAGPDGKRIRIGDGGMFAHSRGSAAMQKKATSQCGLLVAYNSHRSVVKVYGSLPKSVMQKRCPTWEGEIREIFSYYANMAPVMKKHGIINLRDIDDVRSKLHLINMSMFQFDIHHSNFMPTSRDLSGDKTELVRRWIECEARGRIEVEKDKTFKSSKQAMAEICGSAHNLQQSVEELRELLQFAMWIELYTIPPYLTAYLSLKQEANKEIRNMLKSISTEEMLHLILDANVLNAVGGNPNLTNDFWLPHYPTPYPSKDFFKIKPDLILKLEKFSPGLVKDVFIEIEKPASPEVLRLLHVVALIWKELPVEPAKKQTRTNGNYPTDEEPRWFKDAKISNVNQKIKTLKLTDKDYWKKLFNFATEFLEEPRISDVYTIGAYYAHVMLRLIQLEAGVKVNSNNETIFTGDPTRQFGLNQWYATKGLSSAILFPVYGLRSAVKALLEIVYEGEGGSPCVPYITNKGETFENSANEHSLYGSKVPSYMEKSHYIKFLEMVNEKKLVAIDENPPQWYDVTCMPQPQEGCGCQLKNSTVTFMAISEASCKSFCFIGESLSVPHRDIWPIEHIQKPLSWMTSEAYNTVLPNTFRTLTQFNRIYTDLLRGLEESMNGKPGNMPTCMGRMFELLDSGKQLVRNPIFARKDFNEAPTAMPDWKYLVDPYKQEGIDTVEYLQGAKTDELIYC